MDLSRPVTIEERKAAEKEKDAIPFSWNSLEYVLAVAKYFLLSNVNCQLLDGKEYAIKKAAFILKSDHHKPEYFISYNQMKNPFTEVHI